MTLCLPLMRADADDAPAYRPRLTARQQEVAERIAAGDTRAEVARRLGVSELTVKRHLEEIAMRLDGAGTLRARICRFVLASIRKAS
jgi:DNA-binding CsgD family transcriptional regulator